MAIFLACVYIYLLVIVLIGPEKRNIDETKDLSKNNGEMKLETLKNDETLLQV
jgi:hypothetical protein